MGLLTCQLCRGPMDVMQEVYLCVCAPPCRLSWCWRCARVWLQGACARAFLRELKTQADMVEHWEVRDGQVVGTVPRPAGA